MARFFQEDIFRSETNRVLTTRETADDDAIDDACRRARPDDLGSDLVVGEGAEQFAEAR